MDHARVAVFEDQESIRQILSLNLSACGHTVALEAGDMDAARNLIETLEEDSFDVAVVDGNLGEGTVSGDDGAEIARLLRQKDGKVAIIGFSATNSIAGADLDAGKDIKSVVNIIAQL